MSTDTFRDPRGLLLDVLPWSLRRLYFAAQFREWPWRVPVSARRIRCRRPSQATFDLFRP